MSASIVRPMSWGGALLTLVPLSASIALFWASGLGFDQALWAGSATYLAYRWIVVRRIILKDHRAGVLATRRGRFEEALQCFERSEAAFLKRERLDRYRAVLLGSASSHRFLTLARYNQAYAVSRLGRGAEALERLDAVLAEHSDMVPARELRDVLLAGSTLHPEVGEAMSA